MNECMERLKNGIITENPVFIMALGLCPTFAVTTNATNAIGMGLSSLAVLMFSNLLISAMSRLIPGRVRLPAEIVVVASLVTIVQLLIQGFAPSVYDSLGIYIPLIVVNCIILGRAEAYALGAKPIPALFDGIGMGLGFTIALLLLGAFREIIGAGSIFGIALIPEAYHIAIFVLPPGAFLVMAFLVAAMQYYQDPKKGAGASSGPSLEEVKTVVVKPAPKPVAPKAVAQNTAAPSPVAAAAPKPAEAVRAAAPEAAETGSKPAAEAAQASGAEKKEAE
ncbi:MAG: electron transport complex subunit RsxE [Stomatobaculum sp.]